jgi:hypothetical protein
MVLKIVVPRKKAGWRSLWMKRTTSMKLKSREGQAMARLIIFHLRHVSFD